MADTKPRFHALTDHGDDLPPAYATFGVEASLEAALERVAEAAEIDMLFCSCTSIRLLEAVARLEQRFGVPVASSNSAIIWHSLRLVGIREQLDGFGRLYGLSAA